MQCDSLYDEQGKDGSNVEAVDETLSCDLTQIKAITKHGFPVRPFIKLVKVFLTFE